MPRGLFPLSLALCLACFAVFRSAPAAEPDAGVDSVVELFELLADAAPESAAQSLAVLGEKARSGDLSDEQSAALRERLGPRLKQLIAGPADSPLYAEAVLLAAVWKEPAALAAARKLAADRAAPPPQRLAAVGSLAAAQDEESLALAVRLVADTEEPAELRGEFLGALGRWEAPRLAVDVLAVYAELAPELQPRAIELVTQRPTWSKTLLELIRAGRLPASVLNANQASRLQASPDAELAGLVRQVWGAVRTERDPQREAVIAEMRKLLTETPGDGVRGGAVFHRVCGQCHQLFGRGQEVGPDLTANGRSSREQLLSNVFDPSLVIGAAYQARTVLTADGRVLTGLVVEESTQRIVLKLQGGKQETVAAEDVEEVRVSQLSLMPEGLEKQLQPQEIADLFAYLALEAPPAELVLPEEGAGGE